MSPTLRPRIVVCETEKQYLDLCTHPQRHPLDIPCIEGNGTPKRILRLGADTISYSAFRSEIDAHSLTSRSSAQTSERQMLDIRQFEQKPLNPPPQTVVASGGPSQYPAAVLSLALGSRLTIAADQSLFQLARERLELGPVVLVLSLEEATDQLMISLLDTFQISLRETGPWSGLPEFSLVTARDLSALSWVIAKIAIAASETPPVTATRIVKLNGTEDTCVITEIRNRGISISFGRRRATYPEVVDALMRPASAAAHLGHGRDACASVGSGVWLCGRHKKDESVVQNGRSVLACGLGQSCLRGPYPVALSSIPARMLMLSSCSSLRIADSNLTSDFNLGLEFLDGEGRAYVGTIRFQIPGAAADAFLSAIASGLTLAKATNITNAYVSQTQIDLPAFVSIGNPADAIVNAKKIDAQTAQGRSHSEAAINTPEQLVSQDQPSGTNLVTMFFSHSSVVEAAKAGLLSFSADSDPAGEPIKWFSRIESRLSSCRAFADGGRAFSVRVFFFRFPAPLTRMTVTPRIRTSALEKYEAALGALDRWIELFTVSGLKEWVENLMTELESARRSAQESMSMIVFRSRYDGAAYGEIEDRRRQILALDQKAAHTAIQTLLQNLTRPWFLMSSFASAYAFDQALSSVCPYCSGPTSRTFGRNALHGDRRLIDTCFRCGAILDLRERGSVADIAIDSPNQVTAGASFEGRVRVIPSVSGIAEGDVLVSIRITVLGRPGISPWQETTSLPFSAAELVFPFQFEVPRDLLANQCELKTLVATCDCIGFAQRPLVLCLADD